MPGRLVDHARPRGWLLPLAAAAASVLVVGCSSTPAPSPYTPSPAPAAVSAGPSAPTPAVSSPTVTSPAATSPAATAPARVTSTPTLGRSAVRATPTARAKRPAGPVLRTSYPGITRLVIVESYLNKTPAGINALNTVAAYSSALATATTDRTIEPARRLAASSCIQCTSDVSRIASYVAKGQVVTLANGNPNTWASVALFIASVSPTGVVAVDFDGIENAVIARSKSGALLGKNKSSLISFEEVVDVKRRPKLIASLEG